MRTVKIADMTLRQSDIMPSFREKLEIAKQLDTLNVDIIEMAALTGEKSDELLVKSVASVLKNSVLSIETGLSEQGVDRAWEAVSHAARPRLHVTVPVSAVQMEYLCSKKPDKVLELIDKLIKSCVEKCDDVEFSAADATRSERSFLVKAIDTAVAAGAKTVTLCDSIGTLLPAEIGEFFTEVKKAAPALEKVECAVQCSNEIKMAAACAFSAVSAGTDIIKTTICGASTPTLDAVAHTIHLRGDSLGITDNLNDMVIVSVMKQLVPQTKLKKSENSPFDNGVSDHSHEQTAPLCSTSGISDVIAAVKSLGYSLSEDDNAKVFEAVMRVAKKKQEVGGRELEAIVASTALQVQPTYKLVSYVINSGNIITPTAQISLEKNGKTLTGLCAGDGPIDAAFLAVEQIIGHHYELDDFQIQAVTQGKEAMGDALVKLRSNGKLYSGKGISTDIIGASLRAYINALNKIVAND